MVIDPIIINIPLSYLNKEQSIFMGLKVNEEVGHWIVSDHRIHEHLQHKTMAEIMAFEVR